MVNPLKIIEKMGSILIFQLSVDEKKNDSSPDNINL